MEPKSLEYVECPLHPNRQYRYICLYPECHIEPKCCIICIKDKHRSCNDDQIVDIRDFLKKLIIHNRQHSDTIAVRDYVKDFIDVTQIDTLAKIKRKKNMLKKLHECNEDYVLTSLNEDKLKNLYARFTWNYNEDSDVIEFIGSPSLNQRAIKSSMELYQKEFQRKLNNFIATFANINIQLISLDVSNFDFDSTKVSIEPHNSGVSISRIPNTDGEKIAVIYKPTLTSNLFKITITGLRDDDKYLDIGVLQASRYKAIREEALKFQLGFGSTGTISYNGYSMNRMKAVTGKTSNHYINKVYWVKYNEVDKEVVMYDKVDMKLKNVSVLNSESYHFFVVLKHVETSCDIEVDMM